MFIPRACEELRKKVVISIGRGVKCFVVILSSQPNRVYFCGYLYSGVVLKVCFQTLKNTSSVEFS